MKTAADSIKTKILNTLYLHPGRPVSGVELSRDLDISRVAVWKHIKTLKETGISILSGPKGYMLDHPEDLLLPLCFEKKWQERIHYHPVIDSTMDEARKLARKKAAHFSVVIAEEQTQGRGRMSRQWFSNRGGLWFTLILRPLQMPPMLSYIYNFAASLSLSRSLKQLFDLDISVKWPNDLLLGKRKLSGLLSEMETRGDLVEFINIGIGLNVNNHPEKHEPRAISLSSAVGRDLDRKKIMTTFLNDFEQLTLDLNPGLIMQQWKAQTSTIGSQVRIETLNREYHGKALDVADDGTLIIEDQAGRTHRIVYGDCFHS